MTKLSTGNTCNVLIIIFMYVLNFRSRNCGLIKIEDGVCESCKVLINNLFVSQTKEERANNQGLKQLVEEEEEEKAKEVDQKYFDKYDSDNDNMDDDQDILPADSDHVSEDEENVDKEDPGSDPEFYPDNQL